MFAFSPLKTSRRVLYYNVATVHLECNKKINKLPSASYPCCFVKSCSIWPSEFGTSMQRKKYHMWGWEFQLRPGNQHHYVLILTLQDHACKRKQHFETMLCRDLKRMILVKETLMSITLKYVWKCLWISVYSKITEDYEILGASRTLILGIYLGTLVSNVLPAISPATPNTWAWASQALHLPRGSACALPSLFCYSPHEHYSPVCPPTTPCTFVFSPTCRWQIYWPVSPPCPLWRVHSQALWVTAETAGRFFLAFSVSSWVSFWLKEVTHTHHTLREIKAKKLMYLVKGWQWGGGRQENTTA